MDHNEFFRLVRSGGVQGVYLMEGTEEYIKGSALAALEKALLPEGMEQLNESVLEGPDAGTILAACETVPFLAEKRLVVVKELAALTGREEPDPRLLDYLTRLPETTVLVFYVRGKADARKKLFLQVKKTGTIVSFGAMNEAQLNQWVAKEARGMGFELAAEDVGYLVFTAGSDAALLRSELGKLAGYVGDRGQATREDIDRVVTRSLECTVFNMVDAVVAGQEGRAFAMLSDMLKTGGDRMGILAMLLRQYRMLLHVKIMQYEKLPPAQMRQNLGMPGFAADRTIRQAGAYTGKQVRRAADLCLDAEYRVKSGAWNQEGALEKTMLDLFQLRKPATEGKK